MVLSSSYNRKKYLKFFQDELLPEDFEIHGEKIEIEFQRKFIKNIYKIGECPSLGIVVYEIIHTSEHDPRISLSRESFRLLSQYGVQRALVLFVPENQSFSYRLSLITIDLKWEEGTRVKKEYSNPHRYSFLLGPDSKTHTPEYYLVKKGRVKDLDDLKNRFSIEVVNKDFYTEIACLFTRLAGGERTIGRKRFSEKGCLLLPGTSDENTKKEFVVRLIGRLIFCWFLKKKNSNSGNSLVPESLLSTNSVKQNPNFYHTVLEPLFFETLNTPLEERNVLYKSAPWDQIPFLNGGLFEPGMHDYYNIDQLLGVSKYINTLKIPDVWLIDLFEIFETYNFTIDENTSVDIELSIEPEMLGRIFENLLAEINPETGETARKSTGSYYTPRSIVDFMVNESLKQYLLTKTSINESNISSLLAYEEETVELSEAEQDSIIDALDNIKIIDPACGSGAFPMGILQKMLLILQKIDPESRKWAKKKIDRIDNYILKNELQKKIDEGNWNYLHKLGIIQNSIYGVDIQSVAVDISKLRFFLSLIVDENVDDSKPNRGVKPLPNLEFKFVCANSLISLPGKNTQAELFEEAKNIEDLRKLRETYFRSYGNDKKAIEKEFQDIQNEMFRASLLWLKAGKKESQAVKLSQWKPFSGEPCEWFDPDWMFGIKNGFDIVIGNPPYGNLIEKNQKNTLRKVYKFSDLSEISSLFVEKGFDILKKQGCIVFIITFAITFGKNFSKIRFLLNENFEKTSIVTLDRDRCSTFESVTQSVSVFISLNKHPNVHNGIYTSRFFRSFPNLNQIEYSYSNDYLLPLKNVFSNQHRLPKIGENTNKKVLGKLFMYKDVCSKFIDKGEKIWIRTSGNYWYNAFDRKPYESTEIKLLKVDEEYSDFIIILINSSLFYFWFRIYGDGRHMNRDIFGNFPLPQYSDICKNRLLLENVRRVFMERLFSVFDNQRNRFSTSAIKEYIDLLDIILGKYFYNLSYQQIIHILNYDNEIRGGTKLNSHIIDCMNKIILTSKNAPIQRSKEDQYRIQQLENQIDVLIFKEYDI